MAVKAIFQNVAKWQRFKFSATQSGCTWKCCCFRCPLSLYSVYIYINSVYSFIVAFAGIHPVWVSPRGGVAPSQSAPSQASPVSRWFPASSAMAARVLWWQRFWLGVPKNKKNSYVKLANWLAEVPPSPLSSSHIPVHTHSIDGTALHLLVHCHFPAETFVVASKRGHISSLADVSARGEGWGENVLNQQEIAIFTQFDLSLLRHLLLILRQPLPEANATCKEYSIPLLL